MVATTYSIRLLPSTPVVSIRLLPSTLLRGVAVRVLCCCACTAQGSGLERPLGLISALVSAVCFTVRVTRHTLRPYLHMGLNHDHAQAASITILTTGTVRGGHIHRRHCRTGPMQVYMCTHALVGTSVVHTHTHTHTRVH